MNENKLFAVEFGEPSTSTYSSDSKTEYVIAKDYQDAEKKAYIYREQKIEAENKKSNSVIDSDGSLKIKDGEDHDLTVRNIRMISNHVVL